MSRRDETRLCIGFDDEGNGFDCPNDAGTPWTPLWCIECDERRRARIGRQLNDLRASFDKEESP